MTEKDEDVLTSVVEVEEQPTYEQTGLDEQVEDVEESEGEVETEVQETQSEEVVEETSEPDVPAYEPNYGYQANQEQKEFPDWAREYVKDKETEDRFREVFEKYDGFDTVKGRYETEKSAHGSTKEELDKLTNGVNNLKWQLDNDPATFFSNIGWTDKDLLHYAKSRIQYSEMNPQQQLEYDRARDNARSSHVATQQLDLLKEQNEQLQLQQLNMQFDHAIGGVNDVASVYDQRVGRVGAFREKAASEWNNNASHSTPSQAVNAVVEEMKLLGLVQQQQDQQHTQQTSHRPPATLPNVGTGRSTSAPTKKVWSSLDEMREDVSKMIADG